jgi:hypothetical protein
VFRTLCTPLNLEFGLGPRVLEMMEVRDLGVVRKVNILWTAYTDGQSSQGLLREIRDALKDLCRK